MAGAWGARATAPRVLAPREPIPCMNPINCNPHEILKDFILFQKTGTLRRSVSEETRGRTGPNTVCDARRPRGQESRQREHGQGQDLQTLGSLLLVQGPRNGLRSGTPPPGQACLASVGTLFWVPGRVALVLNMPSCDQGTAGRLLPNTAQCLHLAGHKQQEGLSDSSLLNFVTTVLGGN